MKTALNAVAASFILFLCLLMPGSVGATSYTLTLTAQGSGTIYRNPTNTAYPSNVVVTITGTPNAGWYFANWSGDTNSTANPLNVTMDSNLVITGNFVAYPTYTLALATNGLGMIALSPPGGSYLSNTMVTATATAATGWVFAAWSGATNSNANPVSFAVNTNGTLTGTFAELPAFDVQPVSVTNKAGSTVNFSAHAAGTGPLGYEWHFSGGSLTTVATNTTLSLTNVGTGQVGTYWVVATNNYGSATSHVASLTLTNSIGPTNLVNSPNEGSLLAAIALGGWVGIQFNGTLTLTNSINITNNVVLDGTGFTATISGGNEMPLFYVANGASLTLSNLTLANGNCMVTNGPPGTPADGGAIYNNGGVVTAAGCTLTNNVAQSLIGGGLARGGAIFNNGGTVSLYQSVLISNLVVGGVGSGLTMGGAIFQASGTINIINSSFALNQAVGGMGGGTVGDISPGSPAYGGAMAVTGGSLSIELSQFVNNQAKGATGILGSEGGGAGAASGGALYCTGACSTSDSTFSGNSAVAGNNSNLSAGSPGCGGGIYSGGTLTLNHCSIDANTTVGGSTFSSFTTNSGGVGLGGGIFNASQLAATNCTFALNSAVGARGDNGGLNPAAATTGNAIGGGIYNSSNAVFSAMNLTIASNSCSSPLISASGVVVSTNGLAAGSQIGNSNTNGTLHVHNTLIAYGTNNNAYGPITDDGYNICSDGSANLFSGSSYNYTDPQLAPLGNYGGPTLCMALLATSPAIDSGDPSDFPPTDQRRYIRPFGSGPDMGAYEYGSASPGVPYLHISVNGANVLLSFPAFPPSTYYLQCSTNLATWINLSTNGPLTVSTNVSQNISKQGINRCFFRLLLQ